MRKKLVKLVIKMGPGPRFEPESQDPQSRRITAYPTPAFEHIIKYVKVIIHCKLID